MLSIKYRKLELTKNELTKKTLKKLEMDDTELKMQNNIKLLLNKLKI